MERPLKERRRHEFEVEAKQAEVFLPLFTHYGATIGGSLPKNVLFMVVLENNKEDAIVNYLSERDTEYLLHSFL